jgi:hypothetical protein
VGAGNQEKETTMTHLHSSRTAATSYQPLDNSAEHDTFLLEDEFDDHLDRQLFEIREALADYRNC